MQRRRWAFFTGLLVSCPRDSCTTKAAQEALANLLSDPELQSAMGRAGAGTEGAAPEPKREAPAEAVGAKAAHPDVVLAEVMALQQKGFSPGFLMEFVRKKTYSRRSPRTTS